MTGDFDGGDFVTKNSLAIAFAADPALPDVCAKPSCLAGEPVPATALCTAGECTRSPACRAGDADGLTCSRLSNSDTCAFRRRWRAAWIRSWRAAVSVPVVMLETTPACWPARTHSRGFLE